MSHNSVHRPALPQLADSLGPYRMGAERDVEETPTLSKRLEAPLSLARWERVALWAVIRISLVAVGGYLLVSTGNVGIAQFCFILAFVLLSKPPLK